MSDIRIATKSERKRIPVTRATTKPDVNVSQMNSDQIAQEILQKEKYRALVSEQELELVRLRFDNSVLVAKLGKANIRNVDMDQLLSNKIPNMNDIDLFYNTKSNYLDLLQKNIKEKDDALRVFNYHEAKEENLKTKHQLTDLKTDYKNLAKKYLTQKTENKDLMKIKREYDIVFPRAKIMRKLLKKYYETNKLTLKDLEPLHLEEEDVLLDKHIKVDTSKKAEDANKEEEPDAEELKLANNRMKKAIAKLNEEVKKLAKDVDTEKTSSAMRLKEMQVANDADMEKLRAEHAKMMAEIRERHTTELNSMAVKIAKYESGVVEVDPEIENKRKELEKKIQELEKRVQEISRESAKQKNVIKDKDEESNMLREKIKKIENKMAELTKERDDLLNKSVAVHTKKSLVQSRITKSILQDKSVIQVDKSIVQENKPSTPIEKSLIKVDTMIVKSILKSQVVKVEDQPLDQPQEQSQDQRQDQPREQSLEQVASQNEKKSSAMKDIGVDKRQVVTEIQHVYSIYQPKTFEKDPDMIIVLKIKSGEIIGVDPKLIEQVEHERDTFREEVEEISAKYNDLVDQQQTAGEKLTNLQAVVVTTEKTIEDLTTQNKNLRNNIEQLREKLDEEHMKMESMKELIPTETGPIKDPEQERLIQELEQKNTVLNEKINSLGDKVVELTQEINCNKAEKETLELEIKQYEEKISRKDVEIGNLNVEVQNLMSQVAAEKDEKQKLKEELEAKNETVEVMKESQIVQTKKEGKVEEIKEKLSKVELEKTKLEKVIQIKDLNLANTVKEMNNLRNEISTLQTILVEKKQKYKERLNNIGKDRLRSNEEVALMEVQLRDREKEIDHLRAEAMEKNRELRVKNEDISKLTTSVEEKDAESKNLVQKITELKRYKLILDEMSKNQGDIVEVKTQNSELKETVAQLQEYNNITEKENEILKKKADNAVKQLEAKDKEIEKLMIQHRDLEMQKYYESGIDKIFGQKSIESEQIVADLKNQLEKEKKEKEVLMADLEQLQDTMVNQKLRTSKDLYVNKVVEKEKEQLYERTLILETEVNKYVEIIRDKDILIQQVTAETKDLKENISVIEDLQARIRERDIQVVDLITDTNYKTDVIESLEAKYSTYEQQIVDLKHKLEVKEEKLSSLLVNTKRVPESAELRRYRAKNDIPESTFNTHDELFRLYRTIDDNKLEIEYIKKQIKSGSKVDETPFIQKYQSQIDALKFEVKVKDDDLSREKFKLDEQISYTNKLEAQIRELNDRIDARNNELIRLQGTIAELTYTNKQLENTASKRKAEHKAIKADMDVKEKELRETFDVINDLKLKIHNFEIDKKILQKKINNLHIELKSKDQELAIVREENYELQDNLISGTEDFIEKINVSEERARELERKLELKNDEVKRIMNLHAASDHNIPNTTEEKKMQADYLLLKSENETLTNKIRIYLADLDKQESILRTQNKQINEMEIDINSIQTEAQNKIQELSQRVKALKGK